MARLARLLRRLIYGRSPTSAPLRSSSLPQAVVDDMLRMMTLSDAEAMREQVLKFEAEFALTMDVRHALGVDSGTSALFFALNAVGVQPGDEVITVANTFVATVTAIREAGAVCRFVDIDPRTGVMDVDCLAQALNERTRAVIPVHMYGQPVDMPAVMSLCRPRNIPVIEDACQGIGARMAGKPVGTFGDIGCFSFHVNKLVGAPADGGMLITNDDKVARLLRAQCECDWRRALTDPQPRVPSRLPALSLPLLRARLRALDGLVQDRQAQHGFYERAFQGVPDAWVLKPPDGGVSSYRSAVLVSKRIEVARKALKSLGWEPRPMYIPSADFIGALVDDGLCRLPATHDFAQNHLLLPMGPSLSDAELARVAARLREALMAGSGGGTVTSEEFKVRRA